MMSMIIPQILKIYKLKDVCILSRVEAFVKVRKARYNVMVYLAAS